VEIEALVDSGASYLCLPPKVISELGLHFAYATPNKTGNGRLELIIFDGARITIKGSTIQMQILENKDDSIPALIGYLVLETIDWVVDTKNQ
jgi:predicted aspartyl protease